MSSMTCTDVRHAQNTPQPQPLGRARSARRSWRRRRSSFVLIRRLALGPTPSACALRPRSLGLVCNDRPLGAAFPNRPRRRHVFATFGHRLCFTTARSVKRRGGATGFSPTLAPVLPAFFFVHHPCSAPSAYGSGLQPTNIRRHLSDQLTIHAVTVMCVCFSMAIRCSSMSAPRRANSRARR
jgi:hypothetical protein